MFNLKSWVFLGIAGVLIIGLAVFSFKNQEHVEKAFYEQMPEGVRALGEEALNTAEQQDALGLKSLLATELRNSEGIDPSLADVVGVLKGRDHYQKAELAGYHIQRIFGGDSHTVVMELTYPDYNVLCTYTAIQEEGEYRLTGFNLQNLREPLKQQHRLTLQGKGSAHYLMLLIGLGVLAFSLGTAAHAVGGQGRLWGLWAVAALCGIMSLRLNWTTGAFGLNPLTFGLPPAALSRTGTFTEVFLVARIPLGAILYWFLGRRKTKVHEPPVDLAS